jgi:amino acid permease
LALSAQRSAAGVHGIVSSVPSIERERGLRKELSKAQIVMIGLGGAIGTGLFMGSGIAIGYAGPAVMLSYAIAGFAALVMVFSLSEMAVVHPTAGSFGTYAEMYLNPRYRRNRPKPVIRHVIICDGKLSFCKGCKPKTTDMRMCR